MFTDQQLADCLAELKRQSRDGRTVDGIYWPPINAIGGEQSYRMIFALADRGDLRPEVLPGCYGHTIHHFA